MNIKKLLSTLLYTFIFFNNLFAQNDTIYWNADTIHITDNYYLPDSSILIINSGVTVLFYGNYYLNIESKIRAIGTISDSIHFTIIDTSGFSNEHIKSGGWNGIKLNNNYNNDTSIFKYCIFEYGKAYDTAYISDNNNGGIFNLKNYSYLVISNCTFRNNFAKRDGAGIFAKSLSGSLNVLNSNFQNNISRNCGGGICAFDTKLNVHNNLFYKNEAFKTDTSYIIENGDTVGAIIGFGGDGACVFSATYPYNYVTDISNNKAYNNKSIGGVFYTSCRHFNLNNNIACNNEGYAFWDGFGWFSEGKIVNNTFVNNFGPHEPEGGVWSISHSDNYVLKNNIIYGNSCGTGYYQLSPNLPAKYNCIQDGYPGEGNISDNPQFTNPTAGAGLDYDGLSADWTLLETSPCINAGTPDTTGLNLPLTDIAGNPRVYGNRIDMGAYENQTVWVYVNNNAPVAENIKVYPNPGNDKINISLPANTKYVYMDLINNEGKVLLHQKLYYTFSEVYPFRLPSGIYFYRLYTATGKLLQQGKWIKR